MENTKELEKKLQNLIKSKKIVVGVEQNTTEEGERLNKMILKNIWEDEKNNILQLLGFLYQKTILKSRNLRINYNYNYSDLQKIIITNIYYNYDNSITKTKYTFYNIPTNMSYLDTFKITNEVLNNEK